MSDAEWEKFRKVEKVEREDDNGLLKLAVATDYNFHRAGLEIIRRHRPDAYLVDFEGPDMSEHFFWKYMQPVFPWRSRTTRASGVTRSRATTN